MSLQTRRLILLIFIIVFITLTPLLILYCSGYRWDWRKNKIIKTGAFLIESNPKNALIYLNKKLQKKKTPNLINNLLPDEYLIEIKKQNYHAWRKLLSVESKQVTFAQDIQLFLENPSLEIVPETEKIITEIAENDFFHDVTLRQAQGPSTNSGTKLKKKAKGYSLSPNKKKILFWTDFELWIYDLKTLQEKSLPFDKLRVNSAQGKILVRYSKEIIDALWHPENNYVIFALNNPSSPATSSIQVIELDNRDGKNMIELIKADNIEDLLIMKKGEIYFKGKVRGEKGVFKIKIQ
jgi:hypothetical protein